jgi:hypothetical protein
MATKTANATYESHNPNPGNAAFLRLRATHPLYYLSARCANARHAIALHEDMQCLCLVYLAKRALGYMVSLGKYGGLQPYPPCVRDNSPCGY